MVTVSWEAMGCGLWGPQPCSQDNGAVAFLSLSERSGLPQVVNKVQNFPFHNRDQGSFPTSCSPSGSWIVTPLKLAAWKGFTRANHAVMRLEPCHLQSVS